MNTIYLDNNATTQIDQAVLDAMMPYLSQWYGNPSSMHTFGGKLRHDIDHAREQIAALLGCHPEEIIFTSGGTESDNAAIIGALESHPEKQHIITSRVEHPAVRALCRRLQRRGYRLTEVSVDHLGRLDFDELERAMDDETALVTIMTANNETGVIFPVERIARLCRNKGCLFHTDAVQAVGKIPLSLKDTPIHLLSLSGHKLHGPKGVGVLYVRKGTRIKPFIVGGHQEDGRRAGTENVPGIVALGKACELAQTHLHDENHRVRQLRDRLEQELLAACPHARVNGDPSARLPNTTTISFEYIEGEAILLNLDREGICASSGSACTSGALEPSHVLRAMGVPFTAVHGSIRFSLSRFNTDGDIDHVLKTLPPIVENLRRQSPFTPQHNQSTQGPVEKPPRIEV